MDRYKLKDDADENEIERKTAYVVSIFDLDEVCQPTDRWFDECEDRWVEFSSRDFGRTFSEIFGQNPAPVKGSNYRCYRGESI